MAPSGGNDSGDLPKRNGPALLKELLHDHFRTIEDRYEYPVPVFEPGLSTGYPELDLLSGGVQPGRLILMAGVPGAGKTGLAYAIARGFTSVNGVGAAIFSLQSGRREVLDRLLAAAGGVGCRRLSTGLRDADWPRLIRAAGSIAGAQIYLDDRYDLGVADIDRCLGELTAEPPVRLVIIDHLALLRSCPDTPTGGACVRALGRIARERDVCILLVAELTGGRAGRSEDPPLELSHLAHLGLSGREPDVVWLQNREIPASAGRRGASLVRIESFVGSTGQRAEAAVLFCPETLDVRSLLPIEGILGLVD